MIGWKDFVYLKYLMIDSSVSSVGMALDLKADPKEEEARLTPRCKLPEAILWVENSADKPFTQ